LSNVAFIGTGLIGGALAEAAAKRGDAVRAYNRTIEKARALEPFGVHALPTPGEAVRGAERVHVVLSDDAAVDAVIASFADSLECGAVVVDHTTASPHGTGARARALAERGIAFLHAPVFMSPAMCREARGLMLVSGPRAAFDRVSAALAAMTGSVDYQGERPDLAAAKKLFGNAMIITMVGGLADVFALAKSLGIAPKDAIEAFAKFNPANALAYRMGPMAEGDYRASFELSMARKDVRLMLEAAEMENEKLAVLPAIALRMDELVERGFAADDLAVLAVDAVPKKPA
jgi:3-hydroxyisobutyrate dehydrogenase-like beta-hydroxyacid dehydrogenase